MAGKRLKQKPIEDKSRFVFELPLRIIPSQEHEIEIRIQAYRDIKNACIGEGLRRLDLMRESKEHQAARKLPKGARGEKASEKEKEQAKARTEAFRTVSKKFDFGGDLSLNSFAISCRNESGWIADHIGSAEAQEVASVAFVSVQQYAFGKKGRPRFKSFNRCRSITGRDNTTGIRWRTDHVEWGGLVIPAIFDLKDEDGYQAEALSRETKQCRIIRRVERGCRRYYLQLVQVGNPPKKAKNTIGKESVGIDVGPSTVAVVGDTQAGLFDLAPSVKQPWEKIRRIQRAMDRSRRATNPQNYNENGTCKTGQKWHRSKHYLATLFELQEAERVLAASRKRDHGKLQNDILRIGVPKREDVSHLGWQKMFGRSAKVRASGMFESGLKRKAGNAGVHGPKFSTRHTRCSQVCTCGKIEKKKLSQRQHVCECGVKAQRDLFSAFLAKFAFRDADGKDRLDVSRAQKAWAGADSLLGLAASNLNKFVRVDSNGVCHVENGVGTNCKSNPKNPRQGRGSRSDGVKPVVRASKNFGVSTGSP